MADEVDAGKTTRSFNLDEPRDCRGANLIELVDMLFPDNKPKELGDAAANLDQSGRLVVAGYDRCSSRGGGGAGASSSLGRTTLARWASTT